MTATRTPEFIARMTAKMEGIAEAKGTIEAVTGAPFERHIEGIRAHYTKAHEKAERMVVKEMKAKAVAMRRHAEKAERKCEEATEAGHEAEATRFAFMAHEFRKAEETMRARAKGEEV